MLTAERRLTGDRRLTAERKLTGYRMLTSERRNTGEPQGHRWPDHGPWAQQNATRRSTPARQQVMFALAAKFASFAEQPGTANPGRRNDYRIVARLLNR
jgi:hypothetical protein